MQLSGAIIADKEVEEYSGKLVSALKAFEAALDSKNR